MLTVNRLLTEKSCQGYYSSELSLDLRTKSSLKENLLTAVNTGD